METKQQGLTQGQIEGYNRSGYIFPEKVLSLEEAFELREKLEAFESSNGLIAGSSYNNKPHLIFTWIYKLIRHPKILSMVQNILGPNLLVWSTGFFIKEARDPAYVSWHQDSTYWGLSRPDVITVWVAFSPSNETNGVMRVIAGSHLEDQIEHKDTFSAQNLLTRGQEIQCEVDESEAVNLSLAPGEVSLHHVRLIHGSEPNVSDDRRIGLAIRYIPTDVQQISGLRDSATLVSGVDRFHNFSLELPPVVDFGENERKEHARVQELSKAIFYRGTSGEPTVDERVKSRLDND